MFAIEMNIRSAAVGRTVSPDKPYCFKGPQRPREYRFDPKGPACIPFAPPDEIISAERGAKRKINDNDVESVHAIRLSNGRATGMQVIRSGAFYQRKAGKTVVAQDFWNKTGGRIVIDIVSKSQKPGSGFRKMQKINYLSQVTQNGFLRTV
jgi:hypothetical protein